MGKETDANSALAEAETQGLPEFRRNQVRE
jgi:hypothetical protein